MNKLTAGALYKAGLTVFEDLGLMLPTPELDESQTEAVPAAAALVRFGGPISGALVVILSGEDLLPSLAANMLGETETPSEEQQKDALREVTNVICGNMTPHLAGADAVFNLETPEVLADPREDPGIGTPDAQVQIGLDSGRADLRLYLTAQGQPREEREP
jgi:CheY-specific phosphatase CheX